MNSRLFMNVIYIVASCSPTFSYAADNSSSSSGSTGVTGNVDCVAGPAVPASATDAQTAIYDEIRKKCAQLLLNNVSSQIDADNTQKIATALAAFGNIKSPTGTIADSEKASHVGSYYAMSLLYETAARAGKAASSDLGNGKFILVTDPKAFDNRGALALAIQNLQNYGDTATAAAQQASDLLGAIGKNAAAPTPGKNGTGATPRFAFLPILTLIPPAITAAQSLAGLFRQTSSLVAITVQGDDSVLIAGFSACLPPGARSNLTVAGYSGLDNEFLDIYRKTDTAIANARSASLQLNAIPIQTVKNGKNGKVTSDNIASVKSTLDSLIKSYDAYNQTLTTAPSSSVTAPFQIFAETSYALGPTTSGHVILKVAQIGANTGTVSRSFGSDKLEYMATLHVTYLILAADGTIIGTGDVGSGSGSAMTVSATNGELSKRFLLECSKL
jgi:hypothetical protein